MGSAWLSPQGHGKPPGWCYPSIAGTKVLTVGLQILLLNALYVIFNSAEQPGTGMGENSPQKGFRESELSGRRQGKVM